MKLTFEGPTYRLESTRDEAALIHAQIGLALERVLDHDLETLTGYSSEFALALSRDFDLNPSSEPRPTNSESLSDSVYATPVSNVFSISLNTEQLVALNNLILASTMTGQAEWPWVRMEGERVLPAELRPLLSQIASVLS